jgi:outer membrane protein, heavy metal efflux system
LQTAKVDAEARAKRAELDLAQLKLAGDIREAYWAARSAQRDLELAQDEVARTRLLAEDSARRTRAGESARVDTLQADSAAQLAASAAAEARGRRDAANALLSALMRRAPGDPSAVQISVTSLAPAGEKRPTQTAPLPAHATLAQAKFASEVARARLDEATRLSSAPIAAKFAVANERTDQSGSRNTARIGVSIPFDAAFRVGRFSESRATQAARELAETEAAMRVIERTVASDVRAAELALATAEARVPLAKRRAELATEAAALYEKAYRLGELDLPTRLRIEGERANALRDAARAELDVEHAISRLQQALGNLP